MKFTHRWLLQHIDTELSPQTIGDKLTQAGLELEGLTDMSEGFELVQTGMLLDVVPHPRADRLTICRVQILDEELSIICGATNHRAGDMVAVARVGAMLPNGLQIKKNRIRGMLSEGMLCSLEELGVAESADGILVLPAGTPEGLPLAPILQRDDILYEFGLTPNRGDCLGVRGIARELGALTETSLKPLQTEITETAEPPVTIQIKDGVGCPRYAGRIIRGVEVGPTPGWLRLKLEAVGLRCVNNVVDITNYILQDLNQPMHAFDLAKVNLPLQVRRAQEGEVLRALDGEEYRLDAEMTVIADSQQALALAGIMGGESSSVTEKTTDILLESAYFEPSRVAGTGRRLGINSDSRYRFERGTDPEGLRAALDLASYWIVRLAGGQIDPATMVDADTWHMPEVVALRPQRINRLSGLDLSPVEMATMLQHVGCQKVSGPKGSCQKGSGQTGSGQTGSGQTGSGQKESHRSALSMGALQFQPPSYRHDLRCEEDLLEEIVRLYGYDRIPSSLPRLNIDAPDRDILESTSAALRRVMSGQGYLEAINYAFVSEELQRCFDPDIVATALLNPISAEQAVMRTGLMAGLLENTKRNVSRGNLQLRLFEVGRVFLPNAEGGLSEPQRFAGVLTGPIQTRNWHSQVREVDFFDLKGDVEALLKGVGWQTVSFEPGGPDFLHPGRKTMIMGDGKMPLGWMGQLHPSVQDQLDLSQALYCFEMHDVALLSREPSVAASHVVSRFPSVERDFAFVVDAALPAQQLLDAINQVEPELIRTATLFDLYTGEHVTAGRKSLAVCVHLQADDRTLQEKEVQGVVERIVSQVAEQFGATLRR